MIKVMVRESISYETLDSIIEKADRLIKKYENLTNYSDFRIEDDEKYGSIFPVLVYSRPETTLEKNIREDREAGLKKWQEERERKQYEQLKKKFGGK